VLTNYLTDTNNLLQNPGATNALYPQTNVTRWINIARGQVAAEGECIRVLGTLSTVIGQRAYSFADIDIGVAATTGIAGVIHVRDILYALASGYRKLTPRPWEWFQQFMLNNPVPTPGEPRAWSQYSQGAAAPSGGSFASGNFYLDPPPDQVYALSLDCVCYPVTLEDDLTKEAIPYLWTDAVPFFAAYYAYLSSQTAARQADAGRMYQHYQTFLERARKAANPAVLRWQYQQATDPTQLNKLGLSPKQVAGGG
jgi:hypothetical protein